MTPENTKSRLVHIYMSTHLRKRLGDFQSGPGRSLTHAEVILTAIEETHADLPAPPPIEEIAPPPGKLFTRRVERTTEAGERIPVGVRLRESDLDLIADLVSTSLYRSRSAYIVASLAAYLDKVDQQTIDRTQSIDSLAKLGGATKQETPDAEH